MNLGFAITVAQRSIVQLILLSFPVLGVGVVVGLIISIFQATTSIQEQTLTFVPKIFAIMAILFFLGPWMAQVMVDFTKLVIENYIPQAIK